MNEVRLFWGKLIRYGIKQRILLVLVVVLVLTTLLDALLASYFTNRQNQESAFANLDNALQAWQSDLQTMTTRLRSVALVTVGDAALLNQLSELLTLEFNLDTSVAASGFSEMARTLAYRKTVSLNRLQLALHTGGFSSIAVYTRDKLSYYVSETEVGMMTRQDNHREVWTTATANADGDMPFQNWPSWKHGRMPDIPTTLPALAQPMVSFNFPVPDETVLEVTVPIQGIVENVMTDAEHNPIVHFFSDMSIAGRPTKLRRELEPGSQAVTVAVVVFRKSIGRAALDEVARKTGSIPAMFSPDGRHPLELPGLRLISDEMLRQVQADGRMVHGQRHVVTAGEKSYYVAMLPWQFERQPRLTLALASPRDSTLQNIRQTVAAILAMAIGILLLSVAVGTLWVKRLIDPIVHLTAAVNKITQKERMDESRYLDHRGTTAGLQPIVIQAEDEVRALAQAFNAMLSELQQSFETLEQRVHDRTAELRQQTRYVRELFDTLPVGAWLKDTQGRYLAVNQASADACGHSVDEMLGKTDEVLWPAEQAALFRADEAEVMITRQRKIVERLQMLANETAPVWMEIYYAPVQDEDGTLLGTVGVTRNISEFKSTEAVREAALAEAERLARLRSDFLAKMSHELRTPLNGILGYAQILLRDKNLTESQTTGLNIILKSGEHLLTLINDILDLAKIDANKLELYPNDIFFDKFLQVLSEMVGIKAAQKKLDFVCETSPDLPRMIHADERRLRQVLLNLLDNAIKFTDRGRVLLRVGHTTEGRLRFEVEDTGRGIAEEGQRTIFLPFEQAGEARQRMGGTGLGLAISQQFVRLMGGEIQVESRLGEGSRFSFEIAVPEEGTMPVTGVSRQVVTGYKGERKTILVVDDLAENRKLIRDMLIPLGFGIVEAENGVDALKQAEAVRPPIILMDVLMPEMDGLEATRRLRQMPGMQDVAVIAISASVSSSDEKKCFEAGMNAFLAKPVIIDQLLAQMGALLNIEWANDVEVVPVRYEESGRLEAPPQQEIKILHALALRGNMRDIRQHATALVELDERYRPFADKLHQLAREYQSKAILNFVEQYLDRTTLDQQ
ncbi:histidine kinase [Novimethylophilus kurashikiensis]|uniref:Virulence sensor protein BvgS n=1 Tax=Novimethylophilus kurashikiensis TaxID=1825523 RepID=A0A2R5FBX9_9PROT|nr:ATP-binding protein [Novimethylophilus kurashikiensis]GBG14144.1 histidine kinase [Novimethylophilus kurashikiensis]